MIQMFLFHFWSFPVKNEPDGRMHFYGTPVSSFLLCCCRTKGCCQKKIDVDILVTGDCDFKDINIEGVSQQI